MNGHPQPSGGEVERWVLDSLQRREREVDPARILAGVRARLAAEAQPPSPRSPSRLRRWLWRAALAAGVLVATFWGSQLGPHHVSADTLVQQALAEARHRPADRCYQVVFEWQPAAGERPLLLPPPQEARVWTRGDRFWVEPVRPRGPWAWGRDEKGRYWIAAGKFGFRFDANDVPAPLASTLEVFALQPDNILQDALAHCELSRSESAPDRHTIQAQLKPGHKLASFRSALFELDAGSKALQRLVLSRSFQRSTATMSFTLLESKSQPDAHYTLEHHLRPGGRVLSRDQGPLHRVDLLRRLFKR
jgi:hypothetical protein